MSMKMPDSKIANFDRRRFLAFFGTLGLTPTLLPGVLWAKMQEVDSKTITREMLAEAEKIAGLQFTDSERDLMLEGLDDYLKKYEALRSVPVDNGTSPALHLNPVLPGLNVDVQNPGSVRSPARPDVFRPSDLSLVAYWPVTKLAHLLKTRQVTSVELTKMYLARLKKYDPQLQCVVTLTEKLALQQAKRADNEITAGRYRGPLHGIPWGAKDLLSVKHYPTTWGAKPYKDRIIDMDATVVSRLEEAGAVLVAKLTLGALAWGDEWFGGVTKNPWNLNEGSSGSSAGPGAATAAGLVGFTIGSETWGSIVSPSTVCGVTGLRPTYGRVSRYGAMALSWSMDKIGPMCRSVEDCALVLEAIHGPDEKDAATEDYPYSQNFHQDITKLKVGYLKADFDKEREGNETWRQMDMESLSVIRSLGVELIPVELPDYPVGALSFILSAEAGTAFDELTRSNRDNELVRQVQNAWPNVFRQSRFIPAVEYIQANRVRTKLMESMAGLMSEVDVYVTPSWVGDNLLLTNLTGHPQIVLPNGFKDDGSPTSISFVGNLYREDQVLAVANAYQNATGFHQKHPPIENLVSNE